MSKIDDNIREYDLYRERDGLTDEVLDAYVQSISYLMFTEKNIEEGLALAERVKGYAFDTIKERTGADFWTLEKYCQDNEVGYNIVDEVYKIWLMESYYKFESYIFYLEKNRMQDKRFYLPRMSVLHKVMGDLEDLVNRKIKFLGISLPSRTGKSTLCIFFLTWVAMRNPESNSAMGGHSGVLVKGFYDELMNVIGTEEYTFPEIYFTWHKTKDLIQNKSAEYKFINLGNPNRFATLTCRGIDETWTGAVNISWDGILYVDDLVRDREHSLSPSRMDNTWQEYLNKMTDRKSGVDAVNFAGSCELMVGTLWNVYDPLYRMELLHSDDPLYRFRKIPALNEKDETNFPYQYTTEYLHEMRERLDAPEWMAKWQQAPFVREGILIGENELNYFNGEVGEKPKKYIAVLDPAVGGGDYLSMVIIADGKKKYIIDWVYTKETKGKSIPEICRKAIFHNITEIHYEKNGIGRVFDDEVTKELHKMGYYRCKMIPFTAPEGMSKEEKIIGYSDWIKGNLWFIEEGAKSTTYARSTQYQLALNHVFIYTSVGKNKTDDAIDNLAQVARMYEKQSNGTIDVILNPFR